MHDPCCGARTASNLCLERAIVWKKKIILCGTFNPAFILFFNPAFHEACKDPHCFWIVASLVMDLYLMNEDSFDFQSRAEIWLSVWSSEIHLAKSSSWSTWSLLCMRIMLILVLWLIMVYVNALGEDSRQVWLLLLVGMPETSEIKCSWCTLGDQPWG